MVHYKLVYFNIRALGEPIRLILTHAKQSFEDVRISFEDWKTQKPSMPFEKVPLLEVDGKPLAESYAIFGYLAREFGLAGKDSWDYAKVDELAGVQKDLLYQVSIYLRVCKGFVPGDKDKLYNEVFLPAINKYLPFYVKALKNSDSGFLFHFGLTWLDFVIAEFLTTLNNLHPEQMDKFPELKQYRQRVYSLPSIKQYVEQREYSII